MRWQPGLFRPLYHIVADLPSRTTVGEITVAWSICGVPTLDWTGGTLAYSVCRDCQRILDNHNLTPVNHTENAQWPSPTP